MAQITITIPDDKVVRMRDAFATEFGWTVELGVTKTEFARQQVIKFIKNTMKNSEGNIQTAQLRLSVENDIESIPIS